MPDSRIEIDSLEGLFHDPGDGLRVLTASGPVSVDAFLHRFKGRRVQLSLHHLPPDPRVPDAPGAGACFWGGSCPCGHDSNPGWLYNLAASGVLEVTSEGNWSLSGTPIPLEHYMLGHRGRVILFSEDSSPTEEVESLLGEVGELLVSLQGLRTAFVTEED